ncbi:MAG: GH3 auxin-responsive promoter family protein [Saprospiraceae bacterium]|nr:GH3 auxin-responsive promoter family protein [Saprospiraceae bacterium]
MRKPRRVQEQLFQKLIYSARNTQWGKDFGFSQIKTVHDFRRQVPAQGYEELFPYIHRTMLGEPDVLWPGKVDLFSKSSGTTNDKSKYIPVTIENMRKCHIRGTWDTMNLFYHEHPESQIFSGRNFLMSGSHYPFEENRKSIIGDVSALMIKRMPFVARPFFVPDRNIALMPEWESKIEKMAEIAIDPKIAETVTMIGGVPTWVIVFFNRMLELTGKENVHQIWPNFEAYIHGGVSLRPYKGELKRLFPEKKISFREVYNASEGYFGTQIFDSDEDMLLLLDNGVFYEFIPKEEWSKDHPRTLTIDQVERDQEYALMISTNAGLWRYRIGDVIKFTSIQPYKFVICGRTKQHLNVFGEEVMVDNTDQALEQVSEIMQATIRDYTVGPVFMSGHEQGGHEWVLEFENPPHNLDRFSFLLDKHLQNLNSDYEAKRYRDMALKSLKLNVVPKGTFETWMRLRGKFGNQNKVPRLANHRHHIKELLNLADRIGVRQE